MHPLSSEVPCNPLLVETAGIFLGVLFHWNGGSQKSNTGLIWQLAHTVVPGHLADNILGISGAVYPINM